MQRKKEKLNERVIFVTKSLVGESYVSLKIVEKTEICSSKEDMGHAIAECNQIISTFVSSIKTAQKSL